MKKVKIIGLVILWLVVMYFFHKYITRANDNRFAIQPDSFHSIMDCTINACGGGGIYGFPIKVPSLAASGSIGQAMVANLAFAAAFGGVLALLLVKKRNYGVILGLALIFGLILFNVILH